MELDELKTIINAADQPAAPWHTHEQLRGYLHQNSLTVLAGIKKSIRLEALLGIALLLVSIGLWVKDRLFYTGVLAILSFLLCGFFYWYLSSVYRKITNYEAQTVNIRESLQQLIKIIKKFTRTYFQILMTVLIISYFLGLLLLYGNIMSSNTIKNFNWSRSLIWYTVCFGIWSCFTYFFSKWYIQKLYGNYLSALQSQLNELENG